MVPFQPPYGIARHPYRVQNKTEKYPSPVYWLTKLEFSIKLGIRIGQFGTIHITLLET